MLTYKKTPFLELKNEELRKFDIRLLVKREDLNHPFVSGNKWWKLKYNLDEARRLGKTRLLTFGGTYSNHIFATAAAAKESGLTSIGIIRGEQVSNDTLEFASGCGMELHHISREDYRLKNDPAFVEMLKEKFGDFFFIPEGGTNSFAIDGVEEFGKEIVRSVAFDILFLPVGTGGTMAGMIAGFNGEKQIVGVSVLKNGDFLSDEVKKLLEMNSRKNFNNWSLLPSYHHGGYAKTSPALLSMIDQFNSEYDLPLDKVYTSKMMWAVLEEVRKGKFKKGSVILALHTGGLQGNYPNKS